MLAWGRGRTTGVCQQVAYLPGFLMSAIGLLVQKCQQGLQVSHMRGWGGWSGGPRHHPPPAISTGITPHQSNQPIGDPSMHGSQGVKRPSTLNLL